jgi:hypothetical protein
VTSATAELATAPPLAAAPAPAPAPPPSADGDRRGFWASLFKKRK